MVELSTALFTIPGIFIRNLAILVVLDSSRPSTMNLNFRRNLTDTGIECLQRFLFSLGCVHLSPSTADSRVWSLSSTSLFYVKYFFLALSLTPTPMLFHPPKFL